MQREFDLVFLWGSFCISQKEKEKKRMGRHKKIKADESLMGAVCSGVLVIPSALKQSLRAAPPPQDRLLTPFSSLLAPQHCSKGWRHCKGAWGQPDWGRGGAALHPGRQSLEECCSSKHRMINNPKGEGNALKELQT